MSLVRFLATLTLATASLGFDDPSSHPSPSDAGRVAPASKEPEAARSEIQLPPGMKVDLYAAEPLVANPVAFHFDERGRVYIVETFRHTDAVTDNREHMYWLDADLAARTVADRVAMYKKFLPNSFGQFSATEDRVRRLVDTDGDHRADRASVFADGFSDPADGIFAGVLARGSRVWLAGVPSLWLLDDPSDRGKAETRRVLQTGYGVHVAFLGHDLHGLIFGPDGRLYFSIGDRGLHVVTPEGKVVANPDSGAILRCEPDGSKLEIVAVGLRNPQELAFDDLGNLFTVDNNSDSGDKARVVQIVEGGDSGWRIGYQYIEFPITRGPWNAEKLWYPRWDGQAAYILPPLANLSDGPSGLVFDPGVTLLPERFRGRFFLADFRGAHGQSGIRTFRLEPNGASFTVAEDDRPFWQLLATDVDFGPDGALYVSDWVDGWRKTGKGRLWRFHDPARARDPEVARVQRLLREGMNQRSVEELSDLLGHPDRRIRQSAQFEFAERASRAGADAGPGREIEKRLLGVARGSGPLLGRVHAVWALGQIARAGVVDARGILALLDDPTSEIRVQALRVIGDLAGAGVEISGIDAVANRIAEALRTSDARMAMHAARAVGKLRLPAAAALLSELIERNADRDAYLRHAAVVALGETQTPDDLAGWSKRASTSARLAAVLALRRLGSDRLAAFLSDSDPGVVREAAMAIYEGSVDRSLPDLAGSAIDVRSRSDEVLLRRYLAANERVGGAEAASRLLAIGREAAMPEKIRVEAFEILANWGKEKLRDRINGLHRPVAPKPLEEAASAVEPTAAALLALKPTSVRVAAIRALAGLRVRSSGGILARSATDTKTSGPVRLAALQALAELGDEQLSTVVTAGVSDSDPRIRAESHGLLAKLDPEQAGPILARVWREGTLRERQNVLRILGEMATKDSDSLIVEALDQLAAGRLSPEVELDLREAAEKRSADPAVARALARVAPKSDDLVAAYLSCLQGGDADRGARLFRTNTAVECLRCHKIQTKGGEVGPELTGIGAKRDRKYLLEAIVAPNRAIAEGFESVVVARVDGTILTGVFRGEDETHLRLVTSEGKLIAVPKSEIEERRRGPSAMPEDLYKKLSKSEIRDVVEFLSSQR